MKTLELIEKWACPSCNTWYADEEEDNDVAANNSWPSGASDGEEAAKMCCDRGIESAYFCSVCPKVFHNHNEAEEHLKIPHGLTPEDTYCDLLFKGVQPVEAWQASHRVITDDRRIIEEVLLER